MRPEDIEKISRKNIRTIRELEEAIQRLWRSKSLLLQIDGEKLPEDPRAPIYGKLLVELRDRS